MAAAASRFDGTTDLTCIRGRVGVARVVLSSLCMTRAKALTAAAGIASGDDRRRRAPTSFSTTSMVVRWGAGDAGGNRNDGNRATSEPMSVHAAAIVTRSDPAAAVSAFARVMQRDDSTTRATAHATTNARQIVVPSNLDAAQPWRTCHGRAHATVLDRRLSVRGQPSFPKLVAEERAVTHPSRVPEPG